MLNVSDMWWFGFMEQVTAAALTKASPASLPFDITGQMLLDCGWVWEWRRFRTRAVRGVKVSDSRRFTNIRNKHADGRKSDSEQLNLHQPAAGHRTLNVTHNYTHIFICSSVSTDQEEKGTNWRSQKRVEGGEARTQRNSQRQIQHVRNSLPSLQISRSCEFMMCQRISL